MTKTPSKPSFVSGFFLGLLVAVILAIGINFWNKYQNFANHPENVKPDLGEVVRDTERPSSWNSSHYAIPNSKCMVSVGPNMYQDENNLGWDFYTVEVVHLDGADMKVLFRRELAIDSIDPDLVNKKAKEVVSYDAATRSVTIHLGEQSFEYTLPLEKSDS